MAAPCARWQFVRGPVRKCARGRPFNGIVRHRPMSSRGSWTRKLGAISCIAALFPGIIYASFTWTKEPQFNLIFVLFGVAVFGFLAGLAGLISSRGQGRVPILSIIGCVLNVPQAFWGLMLIVVVFGQRH